jgi:hypothetical protein
VASIRRFFLRQNGRFLGLIWICKTDNPCFCF